MLAPSSSPSGYFYDTHLGFTGHVVHRATGLVFAPARVYSPRLRQWLTRDPAGERDAVDGRNLYAYVGGDPINAVDPKGMWGSGFTDVVGILWRTPTNVVGVAIAFVESMMLGGLGDRNHHTHFATTTDALGGLSIVLEVEGSTLGGLGTGARTIGNVIFYRGDARRLRRHERLHVPQHGIFGPFYIPIHLAAQLNSVAISAPEDLFSWILGRPAIPRTGETAWYARHNFRERGPYHGTPF